MDDLRLFKMSDAGWWAIDYSMEVSQKMKGRSIITNNDASVLVQAVINSKHGDHLEIGTFFGHTAILVALAKKEFGMHGKVYCVDPWQYRPGVIKDKEEDEIATMEIFMENAEKFGVADRIIPVPHKSYPWPAELRGKTFATAYLDGDHWNGMPRKDLANLRRAVTYSIIVDDYCWGKTEVIDAVLEAAADPLWIPVRISGLTVVLRRRH